ncbi:hypothetical protein L195_g040661 [Trifolium pratense]|uniref:Uncharacterized protein n=1 Tax=Trifolium pratense TaxID=57577 RepID=A0A2K3M1D5_TRIPR|nr:hypothetical protein L195_g040661 [Trifolium pratense]
MAELSITPSIAGWRNWQTRHVLVMAETRLAPCAVNGEFASHAMCEEMTKVGKSPLNI